MAEKDKITDAGSGRARDELEEAEAALNQAVEAQKALQEALLCALASVKRARSFLTDVPIPVQGDATIKAAE